MSVDEEFSVVVRALEIHRDKLIDMNRRNMQSDIMCGAGIMDQIRHEQIEELNEAIDWYRKRNKDD